MTPPAATETAATETAATETAAAETGVTETAATEVSSPSGVVSPDPANNEIREYGTGEVISLPSHPGASITVINLEWRDRLARQTGADEIGYVDPVLGRFLVVTYEFTNATDTPLDPAEVALPALEEGGRVYQPVPESGILDGNGEPLIAPDEEVIAPGATVTRVQFFDVPNGFTGGYYASAIDGYRVAVGPAQ